MTVIPDSVALSAYSPRKGSVDWRFNRKYELNYDAMTDDINDGPQTVFAYMNTVLPPTFVLGSDSDPSAWLSNIDITQRSGNPNLWSISVSYDSKLDFPEGLSTGDPTDFPNDVLARPPVFTFTSRKEKIATMRDNNGTPIVNAANSPFSPPYMLEVIIPVLHITTNVEDADYTLLGLINCCNDAPWQSFPAFQCKLVGLNFEPKFDSFAYCEYQMTFDIAPNIFPWNDPYYGGYGSWLTTPVLNQGNFQLDSGGKQIACLDKFCRPVTSPVPLDLSGHQIANPTPATVTYLNFNFSNPADFSLLV
jgi:hypothetical protein